MGENPVVLICLVVIPCTYALALVALVFAEYRHARQVIKGRHIVVATDPRTTVVGTDPPRASPPRRASCRSNWPRPDAGPGRIADVADPACGSTPPREATMTGTVFGVLRDLTVLFWDVVAPVKASPLTVGVAVAARAGAPGHPVLRQLRATRPVIPARGAA